MLFATIFSILIIAGLIAAHCFISYEFYKTAVMKGWPQKKYLYIAFFTWIVGYLLIIALPDRGGNFQRAVESDDLPEI